MKLFIRIYFYFDPRKCWVLNYLINDRQISDSISAENTDTLITI